MIDYKLIGERLKGQRKRIGLTQEIVAERVDITTIYLSKIENGHVRPTLDNIAAICDVLNYDLSSLFGGVSVQSDNYQNELIVQLLNACSPKVKPIAIELLRQLSSL